MKDLPKQIQNNCATKEATTVPSHDTTMGDVIKQNYQFSEADVRSLKELNNMMAGNVENFAEEFYSFINTFEHAKAFLKDDTVIATHNDKMREWFLKLFSGEYDEEFFAGLNRISETHSRIGLSTHYINASFNFVRRYLLKQLIDHDSLGGVDCIEKIVDINLDVLTSAYLHEDTKRTVETIKRIKKALNSRSVIPFYQPIVSNESGEIVKYECLARIIEDDSIVSPMDFLPIAKQVKLYPDITREIYRHAFSNYAVSKRPFSLNISIDDIVDKKTNELIFALLEESGAGSAVTFEILESEQIENYDVMRFFIKNVKRFDARIAIDDFGSGFSNFEHIVKMDIDYLKVDGSLIKNLHENKEDQMAVEAIVGLAQKLGVETIAEFVCSKMVHDAVKKAGITYSQGFWLGKPEPISAIS